MLFKIILTLYIAIGTFMVIIGSSINPATKRPDYVWLCNFWKTQPLGLLASIVLWLPTLLATIFPKRE